MVSGLTTQLMTSQITRMDTSVGDGWRESSRPELLAMCAEELAALVEHGGGWAIRPGFDWTPIWGAASEISRWK